ncbi:MAG: DCC1-like thiol-disulfide oxidoreductase family protein [Pseudomonadota bacterium]
MPPTFVYDGDCVLCSHAVRFVLARDESTPPIRYVAMASKEGRAHAERAGIDPVNPSSFVFVHDDIVLTESRAAFALIRCLKAPARWISLLSILPRPLCDAVYRLVARNRYRMFGRRESCLVPAPETRHLFVLD